MAGKNKPLRNIISPFITSKRNYLILIFTIAYLTAFTLNGFAYGNVEFLYYIFLLSFVLYLAIYLHQRVHLGFFILFSLSILGFLHLLGGNYHIGNVRLYDWWLIPGIYRYDNFVHSFATFIVTIAWYSLLVDYIGEPIRKRYPVFALMLILIALGMGAMVEISELGAVVMFGASARVGGYFNNAIDLFYNFIGAIIASILIYYYQYRVAFIRKIDGKD